jgi:hypothetical protein
MKRLVVYLLTIVSVVAVTGICILIDRHCPFWVAPTILFSLMVIGLAEKIYRSSK